MAFWDLRYLQKGVPKCIGISENEHSLLKGPSNICTDSFGSKIYANFCDDHIYEYSANHPGRNPIRRFTAKGYSNRSFFSKGEVNFLDEYYACGSDAGIVYIWNLENPFVYSCFSADLSEINCVTWNRLNELITASDDGNIKIWKNIS